MVKIGVMASDKLHCKWLVIVLMMSIGNDLLIMLMIETANLLMMLMGIMLRLLNEGL